MNKFVFLDTETTGLDLDKDRLIQLSYKYDGVMNTQLFKPELPISFGAMSIHHITEKMVKNKSSFSHGEGGGRSDMWKELEGLINYHGVPLVAHNAQFDVKMLENEQLKPVNVICTLKIARHLDEECLMESHRLQYLRYYFGLEVEAKAHDAEGDVIVLEAVFNELCKDLTLEQMLEISSKPSLIRKFVFGKFNGELLKDVVKIERGYLEWLLGEKQKENKPEDEDWIYTLEYYLGK